MTKTEFRQALRICHRNVTQVMEMPCVENCVKAADDKYNYTVRVAGGFWVWANEGDWIAEDANGNWNVYDNGYFEQIRK